MAKTSKDAGRHIRELSSFFADGKAIANEVIDDFIKSYKNKKYLKQSLDRLVAQRIIAKHENKLKVTRKGLLFFNRKSIKSATNEPWDGKWRIISFDVPGDYSRKRNQLRGLLREFDFLPLQKSVWISPHAVADNFWKLAVNYNLHDYCKIMLVEILEGDRELRKRFNI